MRPSMAYLLSLFTDLSKFRLAHQPQHPRRSLDGRARPLRARHALTCKWTLAYHSGKSSLAYCAMPERHGTDLLFKALADPSRRKLLDLLHAHDGRSLSDLCTHLDMTRQGVTQHLELLEAANLVV